MRSILFRTCPQTNRIVGRRGPEELPRFLFPLAGFLALVWFLLRVAPKPSRASYPCQQAAAPLAGSFLVWLLGMAGTTSAFRQAQIKRRHVRHVAVGVAGVIAIAGIAWLALGQGQLMRAKPAVAYTPHPANSPIGVAKGLKPGRVVWIHDPQVTTWDGATTNAGQRWYDLVSQAEATNMMQWALTGYTDTTSPQAAWDAIFRGFNGGAAYRPGEKVFIKINLTTSNSPNCAEADYSWKPGACGATWASIGQSPQLMSALLDQLVKVVGIAQSDITVGDPTGLWVNELYSGLHNSFPDVKYLDARGALDRTKAVRSTLPIYWSAPSGEIADKKQDYLLQTVADAKYVINFAVLKSHQSGGITATAKNHFGSLSGGNDDPRKPTTPNFYDLHLRLPLDPSNRAWPQRASMAQYRPLVDLNGHAAMGGKTILYLLDGVYAGRGWAGVTSKWAVLPFCNAPLCNAGDESWPASLFLSMDPVAIDSVAFDFLSLRADWEEVLLAEGVQDYLHEMAQANNPPSGTFYDPEHDGSRMASLGVHEHWNNATDKQYTRNLGTEDGIELLYMPRTTYVRKTDQPIVIDGESDTAWSGAGVESLNNVVFGTAAGLSATFRALYTDTDLYFVIDVTDDVVMSAPSTDWHDDDSVTILLDGDYSRGRGYDGANDFELGYRWNDLTIRTGANSRPVPAGAVFDMVRTVSGYRLEARLPLDQIGVTPTCGQMFGLDVRVNDDDDGGVRDAEIAWNAQVNDDGQYPYKFGAGRLAGPESILVEAGLEGNQVHLVWAHPAWYALYEVHRSAAPYFTPDETTKLGEVNAFDSEYLDTPPDNGAWYYLVRISESRLVANSNRTGRFQFDLSTP